MSGGVLRIKLADGDIYEMPEQEAFAAMADLEKRGVNFDATEVPAARDEAPDPSTQPDAPPDGAGQGPGFWRSAYDKLTSGGADADTLAKLRAARPVSGWENFDKAAVSLINPLGMAGGASMGSRLLASAANQGASGGLSAAFNAAIEGKDAGDIAKDTAIGTGLGTVLGGLGGAVSEAGRGAAALGKRLGTAISEGADKARLYAAGLGDESVATALANRLGVSSLPKDLAALVERITPSMKGGMSATQRATDLGGELNSIGGQLSALEGAGGKANHELDDLIPGAWENIARRLEGAAAAAPRASGAERAYANALESNAAGVAAEAPPSTVSAFRGRKGDWQGQGHTGTQGEIGTAAAAEAAATQGRIAKEELEAMYGQALNETRLEQQMLNRDYQVRAALKEAAENAPKDNVPGWLPRVGGAVLGGAAGGALSGPAGAMGGAAGGAMYGARAAGSFTGTKGADYWANVGRMLERQVPEYGQAIGQSLGTAGDAISGVGRPAAVGLEDLLRREDEEERY